MAAPIVQPLTIYIRHRRFTGQWRSSLRGVARALSARGIKTVRDCLDAGAGG